MLNNQKFKFMEFWKASIFIHFDFLHWVIKVEIEWCLEEKEKGNSQGKNQTKQLKLTQSVLFLT